MQLRMTNQREMILRELNKSKEHLSADELYERIKKIMPRISLATVYRNLEILSEAGVIAKLEISGRLKRFDYEVKNHNHIHCVKCNRIDNLDLKLEPLDCESLSKVEGYTVTGCRIEVNGLCSECLEKAGHDGNDLFLVPSSEEGSEDR